MGCGPTSGVSGHALGPTDIGGIELDAVALTCVDQANTEGRKRATVYRVDHSLAECEEVGQSELRGGLRLDAAFSVANQGFVILPTHWLCVQSHTPIRGIHQSFVYRDRQPGDLLHGVVRECEYVAPIEEREFGVVVVERSQAQLHFGLHAVKRGGGLSSFVGELGAKELDLPPSLRTQLVEQPKQVAAKTAAQFYDAVEVRFPLEDLSCELGHPLVSALKLLNLVGSIDDCQPAQRTLERGDVNAHSSVDVIEELGGARLLVAKLDVVDDRARVWMAASNVLRDHLTDRLPLLPVLALRNLLAATHAWPKGGTSYPEI